jgi:hypothetical protein
MRYVSASQNGSFAVGVRFPSPPLLFKSGANACASPVQSCASFSLHTSTCSDGVAFFTIILMPAFH